MTLASSPSWSNFSVPSWASLHLCLRIATWQLEVCCAASAAIFTVVRTFSLDPNYAVSETASIGVVGKTRFNTQ